MSMYGIHGTGKLWVVIYEPSRKQQRAEGEKESIQKEILDMNCLEDTLWPYQLSC